MEKNGTILVYLTKFVHCRDELGSVGVSVDEEYLVSLALLGLPNIWHSYEDSINVGRNCQDGSDFGRILCKRR